MLEDVAGSRTFSMASPDSVTLGVNLLSSVKSTGCQWRSCQCWCYYQRDDIYRISAMSLEARETLQIPSLIQWNIGQIQQTGSCVFKPLPFPHLSLH